MCRGYHRRDGPSPRTPNAMASLSQRRDTVRKGRPTRRPTGQEAVLRRPLHFLHRLPCRHAASVGAERMPPCEPPPATGQFCIELGSVQQLGRRTRDMACEPASRGAGPFLDGAAGATKRRRQRAQCAGQWRQKLAIGQRRRHGRTAAAAPGGAARGVARHSCADALIYPHTPPPPALRPPGPRHRHRAPPLKRVTTPPPPDRR